MDINEKEFLNHYKAFINQDEKNALIVFDTNILLNYYYIEDTEYLEIFLKLIKHNVWIPYQVHQEYCNDRIKKINEIRDRIQKVTRFNELQKLMDNQMKEYENLPGVIGKDIRIEVNEFLNSTNSYIKYISEQLQKIRGRYGKLNYEPNDTYLNIYNRTVFSDIGIGFTDEEMAEISKEAELRFSSKTPPGYMDEGKGINKYGDYIVWLQMTNKANEENKDIIFVSDEKKEDWRIDGSCRIELIKEFKDKTGREFKLMNLGEFIKYKTSSNSISNCLYQLREFDNNNFKTYYPWYKKYNYFKCISTILKARSDEYTYSKGTDDKAYEELIHIRGVIESFFPSFICGGIIMPNYALEMDIFNKDGLLMQNLCRVYYKTNNCIIIGFAARII